MKCVKFYRISFLYYYTGRVLLISSDISDILPALSTYKASNPCSSYRRSMVFALKITKVNQKKTRSIVTLGTLRKGRRCWGRLVEISAKSLKKNIPWLELTQFPRILKAREKRFPYLFAKVIRKEKHSRWIYPAYEMFARLCWLVIPQI